MESPAALVFNNDNYYVVCYSSKHKKQLNYRVDRMNLIKVEEEPAAPEAEILADNLTEYTKQAFRMFSGEPEEVTLQFDRSILGQIYDQFGEETVVKKITEDLLETKVHIQISPTFWGWLFQLGDCIKVQSPPPVAEQYDNRLIEIIGGLNRN